MSISFLASPKRPTSRRKSVQATVATVDPRVVLACQLDRNADLLLSRNCHLAAERLSLRAQALRGVRS